MAGAGSGSGGSSNSALGDVASDLLGTKSQGALVVVILQGRTIADAMIQRFDLLKVYKVHYMNDARTSLKNNTEVAEDKKSGVIVIKVKDHDPKRAAQMAQAYIEELNNLLASVSTSSARRERVFIEDRLKTVKQSLATAEHQFSDYASKNTAIDVPEQARAMVEAAAMLQGQLIAAQSEVQGLSQIYTDSNVRVRSARARVAELQKQLEKMGGTDASLAQDAKSGGPNSDSNEMYPSIRKLPLLGVRWADLYRETKIQETLFELLTGQYEIAKIEEAKEVPQVQVFDPADVPEKKSGPPRLLIMAVGAVFFFTAGTVWLVALTFWQRLEADNPRKEFVQHVSRETWIPVVRFGERVQKQINGRLPGWLRNGGSRETIETADLDDTKN